MRGACFDGGVEARLCFRVPTKRDDLKGALGRMDTGKINATEEEALQFHADGRPGKLSIAPHKPLVTQRDLSLAYSPGVAYPCLRIEKDPASAFDYTSKGNFVAVISNGTAVLGLGDLGALAAKPVMEGKAALFKRFADIDSIDLEIDTKDVDEFVNCVRFWTSLSSTTTSTAPRSSPPRDSSMRCTSQSASYATSKWWSTAPGRHR